MSHDFRRRPIRYASVGRGVNVGPDCIWRGGFQPPLSVRSQKFMRTPANSIAVYCYTSSNPREVYKRSVTMLTRGIFASLALCAGVASAGIADWKPIDPADLALK